MAESCEQQRHADDIEMEVSGAQEEETLDDPTNSKEDYIPGLHTVDDFSKVDVQLV